MTNELTPERLDALESKLDVLSAQVQMLVDAQQPIVELAREVGPIANEMMSTGIDQLSYLQERGYFDIAGEAKYLVDRMVEDYDPSDMHELADNAANILDTVRVVTQPSVMAVIRDAAESFESSRELDPVGPVGAFRKIRKDKNVQRGFAVLLDVLSRIGRASARAPRSSRSELRSVPHYQTPPSRTKQRPATQASARPPAVKASASSSPASVDECIFIPDVEWSRDFAASAAAAYGVDDLTDGHWKLIEFVRAQYVSSGSTPNIRKITNLSGIPTREIYALFPKAPGKVLAAIAGVPKPVGCL